MIAMDRGRHRCLLQPTSHELQQRHLCTRILHCNTVDLEFQIGLSTNFSIAPTKCLLGVDQVGVDNLLGESKALGRSEDSTNLREVLDEFFIGGCSCCNLGVNREVGACRFCKASVEKFAARCRGYPL